MTTRGLALAATLLTVVPVMAQSAGKQVSVTAAVPDESAGTLTITGENFGFLPLVTLDLMPLTIESLGGKGIVVTAPIALMPAGTYLLTVSYGPSPEETGSYQVVLGVTTSSPPDSRSAGAALLPSSDEPAAKVADRVITVADVDREWRRTDPASYLVASRDVYEKRRQILDVMVTNELLGREAAARGLTIDALLKEEIPKRIITMPDSAVLSLYQSLGDRTRGISLDEMRPALRAWLAQKTEPEIARMNYVEELMKVSTRADVFLTAPQIQIERAAQDAAIGPDNAPVEIVVFGDVQSAEYAKLAQAFAKVRDTYGNRVRFVFKNLPLATAGSVDAAEAAECANAQGRFWPYHDALLAKPGAADVRRLKLVAADAGLNQDRFDACVDRGESRTVVRDALAEAARYGVKRSPSFLVNGRLMPDPPAFLPPFDFFKRVIEEQLSRQARKR